MSNTKFQRFSVPLGLLDYINPIFYTITITTIIHNTSNLMDSTIHMILLVGAIISIIVGFIIPTGKVMVGLGIIPFKMPVSLVFCVNTGIFMSGTMLLGYVLHLTLPILIGIFLATGILLGLLYLKRKKMNTIAVLIGAIGYLMLYISLIILSIRIEIIIPILLYAIAILLFCMLCRIGIKANLKDPRIHWIIEISNILCQFLVMIGTLLLWK